MQTYFHQHNPSPPHSKTNDCRDVAGGISALIHAHVRATHTHTHARMHACVCTHTQTIRRRLSRKSRIRRRASYTALFLTVMFPVPRCLSVEHTPGHAHKCMCSCVRAHTSTPARTHALTHTHTRSRTTGMAPVDRAALPTFEGDIAALPWLWSSISARPRTHPLHVSKQSLLGLYACVSCNIGSLRRCTVMMSGSMNCAMMAVRLCAFTIAACKPLDLNPKP